MKADHQHERGVIMQKIMPDTMGRSKQEREVRAWMAKHGIHYTAAKELLEILYGTPKLLKENDNGEQLSGTSV